MNDDVHGIRDALRPGLKLTAAGKRQISVLFAVLPSSLPIYSVDSGIFLVKTRNMPESTEYSRNLGRTLKKLKTTIHIDYSGSMNPSPFLTLRTPIHFLIRKPRCGPGSIPGPGVTCGFFLWVLQFSSLHKDQHSKFQSIRK